MAYCSTETAKKLDWMLYLGMVEIRKSYGGEIGQQSGNQKFYGPGKEEKYVQLEGKHYSPCVHQRRKAINISDWINEA